MKLFKTVPTYLSVLNACSCTDGVEPVVPRGTARSKRKNRMVAIVTAVATLPMTDCCVGDAAARPMVVLGNRPVTVV